MKQVGLYFGSFNPIHFGHLNVAQHFASQQSLDEVWLVVSPHNPLKNLAQLASENHRLAMVELALKDYKNIHACNQEFSLPKPSYTANTLRALSESFPQHLFTIILGEDNMPTFHRWKEYEQILNNFSIRFFPRQNAEHAVSIIDWKKYDAQLVEAPSIEISSTEIRKLIHTKKSIHHLVPEVVIEYIRRHHLYQ